MALDPNRWTLKVQEAFQGAVDLARTRANPEAVPGHLVLQMVGQEGTAFLPVLQRVGVAPPALRNRIETELEKLPKAYGGADPQLSRALRDLLERADTERIDLGDEYVSIEHLTLALTETIGVAREDILGCAQGGPG